MEIAENLAAESRNNANVLDITCFDDGDRQKGPPFICTSVTNQMIHPYRLARIENAIFAFGKVDRTDRQGRQVCDTLMPERRHSAHGSLLFQGIAFESRIGGAERKCRRQRRQQKSRTGCRGKNADREYVFRLSPFEATGSIVPYGDPSTSLTFRFRSSNALSTASLILRNAIRASSTSESRHCGCSTLSLKNSTLRRTSVTSFI